MTTKADIREVDAFKQLTRYIKTYRSSAFNAVERDISDAEAERVASILIRTRLMPTLNGGAIAQAFEMTQNSLS